MKVNISLLCMICGVTLCAMDGEEKPDPQRQLQLIIHNKNTTANQFKTYIESRPRLSEIIVTGHHIVSIPQMCLTLSGLQDLELSNGVLEDSNTVQQILTLAPNLRQCNLAHNKLSTLSNKTTYDDFPTHYALQEIDFSNNLITKVDFTQLRKKLPNLTQLNIAHNPLHEFNINDVTPSSAITTIDLRNSKLPNSAKKQILKNAQQACVINDNGESADYGIFLMSTAVIGAASGVSLLKLIYNIGALSTNVGPLLATITTNFIVSGAFGAGSTYLAFLGCKSPQQRFRTLYIPMMDDADFPEEEITTRYSRFVRHFPYFCTITKCCSPKDPEFVPLIQVEEHQ